MTDAVLSLNAGSSSIKFALYEFGPAGALDLAAKGQIEGIGTEPHLLARDRAGAVVGEKRWTAGGGLDHEAFLSELFAWIDRLLGSDRLTSVGHRVVHGGLDFAAPVLASRDVVERLRRLSPLAPLHQPHNLAALEAAMAARPGLPQVACFDTAFHRTHEAVVTRFALPAEMEREGILRYGFHGLSYEYVGLRLAEADPTLARGRVIVAHLGAGASLCAMAGGRSVDTTMGFTAVDGLMMGTRCGALDPGVVLYLLKAKGLTPDQIEDVLYRRSGLLGVSGVSSDMRTLLADPSPPAKAAVELFVFRIGREAGALASTLGGLDGVVFTAGIGENAPAVRAQVCRRLAWLGIDLDAAANEANAPVISSASSKVTVRVIPTDEERMIALHTLESIQDSRSAA